MQPTWVGPFHTWFDLNLIDLACLVPVVQAVDMLIGYFAAPVTKKEGDQIQPSISTFA